MARLDVNQALFFLEKSPGKQEIEEAINLEDRLRFHTESNMSGLEAGPAYRDFLYWVRDFLPSDKFAKFEKLMRFPIPTVELNESIFNEYKRIFDAENSFRRYQFTEAEQEIEFEEYIEAKKNFIFWSQEAFAAMQNKINSIIIVDLPLSTKEGERPAPYYYLLSISSVVGIEIEDDDNIKAIAFKSKGGKYAVFCSEFYRTYEQDEDGKFKLLSENAHTIYDANGEISEGLGYCPAKMFWRDKLTSRKKLTRKNPITNSLANLDKILFWEVAKDYYELYGSFPIVWAYESGCNYKDEQGNACEDGWISYLSSRGENQQSVVERRKCTACENKKLVGPGSFIEVPALDSRDAPDMREPAGLIKPDVESLKRVEESLQNRKDEVYYNCIGWGGEADNNKAVNEKQVMAGFESKQNILMRVKESFEEAEKWTLDTVARLMFDADFLGSVLTYGDEFYLRSPEVLIKEYTDSKNIGMPMFDLAMIRGLIYETRYKNNPSTKERKTILSNLEPFPDLSFADLANLKTSFPGLISDEDIMIKINFDLFIKRFEREEFNIVKFGEKLTFDKKINIIKTKLIEYAKEKSPQPDGRAEGGNQIQPANGGGLTNGTSERE